MNTKKLNEKIEADFNFVRSDLWSLDTQTLAWRLLNGDNSNRGKTK